MRILIAVALVALIALPALTRPAQAFPSPVSGSYYHQRFEGRTMACGGRFDNEGLTAASNHHPCGSLVRVSYRQRDVVVRITDRCGRCGIDLTRAAARELGMLQVGRAPVRVERLAGGGLEAVGYAPAEMEEAAYVPPAGETVGFEEALPAPVVGEAASRAPETDIATPPAVAEATPGDATLAAAPQHVGAVPTGAIEAYSPHFAD